jgi:cation-transporting ATPase E
MSDGAAATGEVVVDPAHGLSSAEVADRVTRGLRNDVPSAPSRTVPEILRANVLTPFNFLMGSLGALVLVTGEYRDALFLGVVVANALIGIIQELRAKATLDRLAVLNAPRARAVREGEVVELGVGDLVLDDVLELRPGQQIVADALVLVAESLEVDESLLTGEADPVVKDLGDELLSGSFVVAGNGRGRVHRIGAEAYAAKLAEEARRFTLVRSELMADMNRIVKGVTWVLVPTGILLFVSQFFRQDTGWREAVVGAVAGVVGMVPEGLILLTSVAFTVGVLRLARRRCLVQELPAIEVLARVDVVCLDKTGTITEGALDVTATRAIGGIEGVPAALAAIAANDPDPNATGLALRDEYPADPGWSMTDRVPFSSARKWSAMAFEGKGSWVFGAPELVMGDRFAEVEPLVRPEAEAGRRVLLLARADTPLAGEALPDGLQPAALVLLEDRIRADAPATFEYFDHQGVDLKVISGDNPVTVAAVARRAGLEGPEHGTDGRTLPDDPEALAEALDAGSVFGRVTPHQKRAMVKALQSRRHVVAMTGDGVNDVLALKDSDCGIAMAAGSEATRAVAQLVLLDSSFAALPSVVAEGRRVINNIGRVASLFLVKTTYSMILAIVTVLAGSAYPFRPRHLTLISSLTIGIPSFFLALWPNNARVQPGFLKRVLTVAVPGGVLVALCTIVAYAIAKADGEVSVAQARTSAVMVAGGVAFMVLFQVSRPFDRLKVALFVTLVALFALAFLLAIGRDFFLLEPPPDWRLWVVNAAIIAGAVPLLYLGARAVTRLQARWGLLGGDDEPPR